ncbi:MAG: redoxin domain-containing protein, partial [candidate division Zixibacteria bacterium]|nr:redoxin domain-containing protein [candidate division Zixibacteria bacterium]
MVQINHPAPDFDLEAYQANDIVRVNLNDHRGKWVVLFFYPADFTFVCPTELGDLADKYET